MTTVGGTNTVTPTVVRLSVMICLMHQSDLCYRTQPPSEAVVWHDTHVDDLLHKKKQKRRTCPSDHQPAHGLLTVRCTFTRRWERGVAINTSTSDAMCHGPVRHPALQALAQNHHIPLCSPYLGGRQ
jgi:hypothetical protein